MNLNFFKDIHRPMTDITETKPARAPAEILAHDANAVDLLLSKAGARIRAGRLSVVTPSGARFTFKGTVPGPSARIIIHRWRALGAMALKASVGLGQSYARGDWDSPDLPVLVAFLACNVDQGARHTTLARISRRIRHMVSELRPNSLAGSRRKIAYHYDIGNDFYGTWLDSSWTYSGALFQHPDMTLEQAQIAKYRRLAEKLSLAPGDHILEIGCGWGSFALFAALEYGVRVTGVTLSEEQLALARQRAHEAGVENQVNFNLRDYRELRGQYSHIVSVEMLEAVGESYWPVYFDTLSRCLAPGGCVAIQSIVIDPTAYPDYRAGADFIQSCIFPGGMLPSTPIIMNEAERAGLILQDEAMFGLHYARTLNIWRQKFTAALPQVIDQGFDENFCRLWNFYLAYCEGGFLAGRVDVGQWVFKKSLSDSRIESAQS
ncbi:MAG: class I SAM-dependent methyltransferase [Alphaproteobacteria bacterium]